MENVGLTTPESNPKPQQMDLPLEVAEKKEEGIKWEIKVGDGNRDSSGDEGELPLVYDNGKCTIDKEEVPFEAFLFAVGPHQQFLNDDEKKVFEAILRIEEKKKELKK